MKLSIYKLLASAVICVFSCAACSSDESSETVSGDPIVLHAGLAEVSVADGKTRASVEGFDNTPVMFANRLDAGTYDAYWNARISVQGFVVFTPQRVYDMNDKVHTLRGFHPVPSATPVGGNVNYDIDGQSDIMISTEANLGSLSNKTSLPYVTFGHLLTQFRFVVSNDIDVPYTPGKKIKKIVLGTESAQGLARKAQLNLNTGAMTYSDYEQTVVVYDSSSDGELVVPGVGYAHNDAVVVMFEPGKEMKVTVTYEDMDDSKPDKTKIFTLDLSEANETSDKFAMMSYSYKITLAFKGSAVHIVPGLAAWAVGKIDGNEDTPVTIW